MVHEVKSWPRFFTETLARCKMLEIHLDDCGYNDRGHVEIARVG